MNKTMAIIAVATAVITLTMAVIFFSQSRTAQNQALELQTSLNQAEKDLIYYKNSDLGKEVELLNLKLKDAQEDLAASQTEATAAEGRVKSLEASLAKIPAYLSAIDALEDLTANEGPTAAKMSVVDARINALADQTVSSRWYGGSGRSSVDVERRSWGTGIYETEKVLTARIRELIK